MSRNRPPATRVGVGTRKLATCWRISHGSSPRRVSRINQYEHGKHEPDYGTVQRLAEVLEVPTAYFYAENDLLAELILHLDSVSDSQKRKLLRALAVDKAASK